MEPARAAENPLNLLTKQMAAVMNAIGELQAGQAALIQRERAREQVAAQEVVAPPLPPEPELADAHAPEPMVALPEKFAGRRSDYRTFITSCELLFELKPRTYHSEFIKVRTAISLLVGHPQTWAHQLIKKKGPELETWDSFTRAMDVLYGDPLRAAAARSALRALKQGRRPVEEYVTEFREVSADSDLNEVALIDQFRWGLSESLKDELARIGIPTSLAELIERVTQLDRRFRERRQERQATSTGGPHSGVPAPTFSPPTPDLPVAQEEPMQIGLVRGPLTPAERTRRRRLNLCLYCAQSGHMLRECPVRPPRGMSFKGAVCLNLPVYNTTSHLVLPISLQWADRAIELTAILDSGASSCFLDSSLASQFRIPTREKRHPSLLHLVDGSTLKTGPVTLESHPLTLCMGGDHTETIVWDIVPSPLFPAILGIPWLRKHNPAIDWVSGRVRFSTPTQTRQPSSPTLMTVLEKPERSTLPPSYQDFSDVFEKKGADVLPPHRPYDCPIDLLPGAPLPFGRIYSLSVPESRALKEYIEENLAKGFIRPSTSPLGAGIFFVGKKDGGLRPCVDYRGLNAITVKNKHPLPLIPELLDRVRGASLFTKIDLRGAYNLVRIREGDEYKTAFRSRYGHFEYLVMPFGLCNAPATFQYFINDIFRDLLDTYVVIYLDDILIFSHSPQEHEVHVKTVLQRLRQHKLFAKLEKSQFERPSIEFLGYVLSPGHIEMDQKKILAIKSWPTPTNRRRVQQFLGFANFYRRFIRDFSKIAAPITALTRQALPFQWTEAAQQAFERLKTCFTQAPVLIQPKPQRPFFLETDASEYALGAILSQREGDKELMHPVAFYSRRLTPAERNYDVGEKELLAIKTALEEWRHWLEGSSQPVTVYTDHRNLEYLRAARRLKPRQARWALFFARFDLHITYRPGSQNGKADALSRRGGPDLPEPQPPTTILHPSFFLATRHTLLESIRSASTSVPTEAQGLVQRQGLRYHLQQVYVPKECRVEALQHHHDSPLAGHQGVKKTRENIARHFWWPSMLQDVRSFVLSCPTCARSKQLLQRPTGLLRPLPVPTQPWRDIAMDFIVELPVSQHCNTIMVIVDRCTKMAHFVPTTGLPTAQRTAELFIKQIFRLHGVPGSIVSDRGSQFTSRFWTQFCQGLGIVRRLSSAYHPQTNGQTERVNQVLEQYLRCFVSHLQDDWRAILPLAEFAYNNQCHESTGTSPFYANYGYHPATLPDLPIVTPVPTVSSRLRSLRVQLKLLVRHLQRAQTQHKHFADRRRSPEPNYAVGDKVWLETRNLRLSCPSKKLGPRFMGPYPIQEIINPVTVRLSLPAACKVHPVFHVSLLKPWRPNTFPGRHPKPPPPIQVEGDEEFLVQSILDSRRRRGHLEYLVQWRGYGPEENSWEPAGNIHASAKVRDFHRRHPDKPALRRARGARLGGGPCQEPAGRLPGPGAPDGSSPPPALQVAGDVSGGGPSSSTASPSDEAVGRRRAPARGGAASSGVGRARAPSPEF